MEARSVDAVPRGSPWQYEPKWDGFRCLLSRNHAKVSLRSKSGEDLGRYFPELIDAARRLKAKTFLLDGEIVVPHGKAFSFDELLQRIHPAASRISAALLRWRPDKAPRQCRLDQLKQKSARPMKLLT
jgi:ATP-dependent DNA ligase